MRTKSESLKDIGLLSEKTLDAMASAIMMGKFLNPLANSRIQTALELEEL